MPPDFDIATKRLVASGRRCSTPLEGGRVEIVEEVHARVLGEAPGARHGVVAQLRQGLPAEARAAGAEEDDVGRLAREPRRRGADGAEIVARARHVQERQPAARVVLAQARQRVLDEPQAGLDRHLGKAAGADGAGQRLIDRLLDSHESHPVH